LVSASVSAPSNLERQFMGGFARLSIHRTDGSVGEPSLAKALR
jgi:hypothetical protein